MAAVFRVRALWAHGLGIRDRAGIESYFFSRRRDEVIEVLRSLGFPVDDAPEVRAAQARVWRRP